VKIDVMFYAAAFDACARSGAAASGYALGNFAAAGRLTAAVEA
jgi:hypothetical protein